MKNPNANKSLGQHYLKDQSVINKIINDAPEDYDFIVEIGPGPATLTKQLNELNKDLYLIEMDRRFDPQLSPLSNVKEIFYEDALNFNWEEFTQKYPGKIWLVSNLPYNISSLLYISFLKVPNIKHMTLMYQKEVGEKTVNRGDVKNQMNSLLSLGMLFFQSKSLCKVSPGAFNPPPKVDSIVVSYSRLENSLIELSDFTSFEKFIKFLFAGKRKQLGRVLKERKELISELNKIEFDLRRRAETLEFDEVLNIYKLHRTAR